MDASGLTVYKGNIVIKNNDGTNVFYADEYGDLILTGTVQGSEIYGSTIYTCARSGVSTDPHFYIGTANGEPLIQSYNGSTASGFQAVGDASEPYYGLFIAQTIDYRTWYDSDTGTVHTGVDGGNAFFGASANDAGITYRDAGNNIIHYVNAADNGITIAGDFDFANNVPLNYIYVTKNNVNLWGNVYINGVLQ